MFLHNLVCLHKTDLIHLYVLIFCSGSCITILEMLSFVLLEIKRVREH